MASVVKRRRRSGKKEEEEEKEIVVVHEKPSDAYGIASVLINLNNNNNNNNNNNDGGNEEEKRKVHVDYSEYVRMSGESERDGVRFWDAVGKRDVTWFAPYTDVTNGRGFGNATWFTNGKLNVCYNCVDRHALSSPDRTAIIWEGDEVTEVRHITYAELADSVSKFANLYLSLGVKKGDVVCIYMPMVPEAAFAMLACARIGALHSVVFAGFSASSLRDRILDAQSAVLVTADEGLRGGKIIPLKKIVDEAVAACPCVKHVLVHPRTGNKQVPFHPERDIYLHTALATQKPYCPCVWMDSEDPLFILYTSGSTGKPKGIQHTTAGYLAYVQLTFRLIFDYHPGDVYACVADVGWITGHSYIVYGPLCNGGTTFMFESLPTYPNVSRYWDMVQRHKINILYTAPTAIRALMRFGDEPLKGFDRSSLRVLGSVGEPINPEAWKWYHDKVGEGRCAVVDTFWQTETGGIVIAPFPGATYTKPGSATFPFFGIDVAILDERGNELQGNDVSGLLVIKRPWPSMCRTVHNDHERYLNTYLKPFPGYYFTGDGCRRDADGYYWITGRVDDVINVSGHRLGTAEIESALVANPACAEAAVIGVPHELKGQGIFCYVVLRHGYEESQQLVADLKASVRSGIGAIATPDAIVLTTALPKTRSGKIMRRLLRKIACRETTPEELGDISTLADTSVVDHLIAAVLKYSPNAL